MKTYKETKAVVKQLVLAKGYENITNHDKTSLCEQGHNATNIINAIDYFKYSLQATKYRS